MTYAEKTRVSVEKSRAEVERILQRYGCDDFAYRNNGRAAQIMFKMAERMIRFDLVLPDPNSKEFVTTPGGRRRRDADAAYNAWEQACRQRWRALALVIKAKLEAVEAGITAFDVEFLAHTVVPGGRVFHEVALPQIAAAYETGNMKTLQLTSGKK